MSLNLNWSGKFEDDGPHPPSGLSLMGGKLKEGMNNIFFVVSVLEVEIFSVGT